MRSRLLGSLAGVFTALGLSAAEPPAATKSCPTTGSSTPVIVWEEKSCSEENAKARTWFDVEYLLWKIKDNPLPFPVTTTAAANSGANGGTVGDAETGYLIGGDSIQTKWRHGARLTAGAWLNDEQSLGAEVSYFMLAKRTESRFILGEASDGLPFTGFPFVAPNGEESFIANSVPGQSSGRSSATFSNTLHGGEANVLFNLRKSCNSRIDVLGGFRFLELEEQLALYNEQVDIGVAFGNDFDLDQFNTRNRFYGGQLGVRGEFTAGRFFVNATGKVALGDMEQSLDISGIVRVETPDGPQLNPGGIFAQATNSGHHSQSQFCVIPELSAKVGMNLTKNITATAGYNFLYVSDVMRPGHNIDRVLNLSQHQFFGSGTLTGNPRPLVPMEESTFWAQGATVGLEIRY